MQGVHIQTVLILYFLYFLYIRVLLFLLILQALNILYTQKSQDWMKASVSHDTPLPQPWTTSVFLSATIQVLLLHLAKKKKKLRFSVSSLCPETTYFYDICCRQQSAVVMWMMYLHTSLENIFTCESGLIMVLWFHSGCQTFGWLGHTAWHLEISYSSYESI